MIPALIVPILNRPDLLDRMLASIDHPVGDLLIIDNGDVVTHTPYVSHAARVHLIKSPTNLGVPGSWNLGIKMLPTAPWWLVVNNDAWFPVDALGRFEGAARRDALVLSGGAPAWCAFALGDQVVTRVGLFDEGIYPAYCEDDDYTRRCIYHGFSVMPSGIEVKHDNSSTIASGYRQHNDRTFSENVRYYRDKEARGDFSEGRWDLATRRRLSWD